MKNRTKKRWFALIILLLCAVVIGLFYWKGQKKMQSDEGYLVKYSLSPIHFADSRAASAPLFSDG